MKKIAPCLWFDSEAEEAAKFYVSVFPNSKILSTEKYVVETPSDKPMDSVMTVYFELDGNHFMTLNGGKFFKISEAISLMIPCDSQNEMDYYYEKLSADPEAEICGWLKDQFGVSWQLIPTDYNEMMKSLPLEKKKKVMEALMKMKRLNLEEIKKAGE